MSRLLFISADSKTLNPTLEQELIDAAYSADAAVARAEWGGFFRDDVSGYLTEQLLEAALPGRLKHGARLASVAFVDTSGGVVDSSCLGIAHAERVEDIPAPVVILDKLEIVDSPHEPAAAVAQFCETLRRHGLNRVVGDRYAAGWVTGAFNERGIHYTPSELDKSAIYNECSALFSEQRVQLLEEPRLLTELRMLERRPRPGGRPDLIDHPRGAHDDAANACAGALHLALKESASADRPDSYVRTSALRVIEMLQHADFIFAAGCVGAGGEPDTAGTVFFAGSVLFHENPPLAILDWDAREVAAGGLEAWLPWVFERLGRLQGEIRVVHGSQGLLLEPTGSGEVVYARAWGSGLEVRLPDSERLLAMDFAQRLAGAGGHVHMGEVAIVKAAHAKTSAVKGIATNHLLRQLALGINQPAREAGALAIAFATGTLQVFGDFQH
jgi:hypothetical protein